MNDEAPTKAKKQAFLLDDYMARPTKLRQDLTEVGVLTFKAYASGLYPASDLNEKAGEETGMTMAWLRDNAHVIAALYDTDHDREGAVRAGEAILQVLHSSKDILDAAIGNPQDTRNRLTVRVDGNTLVPDNEPRIQNDSTGYALWICSKLMLDEELPTNGANLAIITAIIKYLAAIEYWHDPDDSAWEEDRRIHLASIGVVHAGLAAAQQLFAKLSVDPGIDISVLIAYGQTAMRDIWDRGYTDHPDHPVANHDPHPHEWPLVLTEDEELRQALENFRMRPRPHDAALLFLVEPLEAVDTEMARDMVEDIEEHLVRKHGVVRYPGDTYWSPYFDQLMAVGARTQAADGRTETRNLKAAGIAITHSEAQWTLFDPLLSSYYGKRFQTTRASADREKQLLYLNRSLSQLTATAEGPRLPEAYYLTHASGRNRWLPNPHTPLLWSQANLLRALKVFEDTTAI